MFAASRADLMGLGTLSSTSAAVVGVGVTVAAGVAVGVGVGVCFGVGVGVGVAGTVGLSLGVGAGVAVGVWFACGGEVAVVVVCSAVVSSEHSSAWRGAGVTATSNRGVVAAAS